MKILALDTSTEVCSIALQIGDEVVARFDDSGQKNTDIILPLIDQLMAEAGLKPQALDAIAFARGPGSFTGVRVATGIAQGIAFAADLPVAAISTLAMLAQGAYEATGQSRICTINDARMKEVYASAYEFDSVGRAAEVLAERVCKPEALETLTWNDGLLVGTGWGAYGDKLESLLSATQFKIDQGIKPEARYLLSIAKGMQERGELVSAEQALPVYLRNNVAKKKGER